MLIKSKNFKCKFSSYRKCYESHFVYFYLVFFPNPSAGCW